MANLPDAGVIGGQFRRQAVAYQTIADASTSLAGQMENIQNVPLLEYPIILGLLRDIRRDQIEFRNAQADFERELGVRLTQIRTENMAK